MVYLYDVKFMMLHNYEWLECHMPRIIEGQVRVVFPQFFDIMTHIENENTGAPG
jgi:hypothetical protein